MSDHPHPLVSVIVPTYNRSNYLREALDSLAAQTYPNIETIVVDDGSTDDTPHVAAEYRARIRYIRQDNQGLSAARNTGLKQATGALIAFLDDDDRWLPRMLERMVPKFQDFEMETIVHCKALAFDNEGRTWEHPFIGEAVDLHTLLRSWFPPLQASVFTRSLMDKIGGFDTKTLGAEDWDIFLRAAPHCSFLAVPEALVEIRCHGAGMSKNMEKMALGGLTVLDQNSHYHKDCPECEHIIRETRAWYQRRLFDLHRIKAKDAMRERRYSEALIQALRSFSYNPGYLISLPMTLLRQSFRRSEAK